MGSRRRRRREDVDDDNSPSHQPVVYDSSSCRRPSGRSRDRGASSKHSCGWDFELNNYHDDMQRKRIWARSPKKISEEEIAEYLVKKAQKKAMKVAKKLKSRNAYGYANDFNPFGDSNLNEKLVWRKKIEQDVTQGVPLYMFSLKAEKKKQKERMAEIEKVKKRREERAIEKAQHEEEMALLARERARAEFQDWEKKEEEFHFDQSKVRSRIRLHEGRTKPIDILSKHVNPSGELSVEFEEPHMVFKGLTVKEMEELHEDIKMHVDLDRGTPTHVQYWEALLVICDWELAYGCKKDTLDCARVRGEQTPAGLLAEEWGLHLSFVADVKEFLDGKSFKALEELESKIEPGMSSGALLNVEYWEAILKCLPIYKAKAFLKEIHKKMLLKHLERLEQPSGSYGDMERDKTVSMKVEEQSDHDRTDNEAPLSTELITQDMPIEEEEAGSFSPELIHGDENDDAIDPEEDNIGTLRVMGAMDNGDKGSGNSDEVNVGSQAYWWHDKYRPRKPKYFNRVHTGYEWNKYNQTHYDHDNPPPKTVQGYKFNIFYPDLIDKTKAPVYTIEKDGDSTETCIIRFHAGPPYEDIAFRIVNKEWENSHKKGYKCTFERGILHVYFNFKRYGYRR